MGKSRVLLSFVRSFIWILVEILAIWGFSWSLSPRLLTLRLCYDDVSVAEVIHSRMRLDEDYEWWWVGNNFIGWSLGVYPAFVCRHGGKPRTVLVRICDKPAEIRTTCLPNTGLKSFHYANLGLSPFRQVTWLWDVFAGFVCDCVHSHGVGGSCWASVRHRTLNVSYKCTVVVSSLVCISICQTIFVCSSLNSWPVCRTKLVATRHRQNIN